MIGTRKTIVFVLLASLTVPPLLAGCREKGPAEKAGEKLDEAGRKLKKAVD